MTTKSPALNRRESFARLVSRLSAPPLIIMLAAAIATKCDNSMTCWKGFWTYGVLSVVGPLIVLLFLRAKGLVGDFDLTRRSERAIPMLSATIASGAAWMALRNEFGGSMLEQFAGVQTICLLAITLISLFWKISVHAAAIGSLAAVVSTQSSAATLLVFGVLSLVGWARVCLGKHTFGQICAGGSLSGITFALWKFF